VPSVKPRCLAAGGWPRATTAGPSSFAFGIHLHHQLAADNADDHRFDSLVAGELAAAHLGEECRAKRIQFVASPAVSRAARIAPRNACVAVTSALSASKK
jgi:hypothetical protein